MRNPTDQESQELSAVRIDIIRKLEFMAIFLMDCEILFTDESEKENMKTACIFPNKGKPMILINDDFWKSSTRKQRVFTIVHEILHVFFENSGRAKDNNYDHELWNIATDYCNNLIIGGIVADGNEVIEMFDWILYDEKWKEHTADQIYAKILEENDNDVEKAVQAHGGGAGSGQRAFDEVSSESMTEEQKNDIRQKVAAGISISEMGSTNMGSGYADLIRKLKELLNPEVPWSEVLSDFITKASNNRRTYDRISRRSSGQIVFPTYTGDRIDIIFGVDTSGSMSSDDLSEAMTELYGICESFDDWTINVVSCDTQANLIAEMSSEEDDEQDTLDLELIGGGGTDMAPIVQYTNNGDFDIEPSVCVIVTDGYIPEETLDNVVDDIPVIVIVTKAGNKDLRLENCDIIHMNDAKK